MTDKIKRIFKCKNGHEYESNQPITTSWAESNQPMPFLSMLFGRYIQANDRCKFCFAQIMSETDYVNGKAVMGAVYCPK